MFVQTHLHELNLDYLSRAPEVSYFVFLPFHSSFQPSHGENEEADLLT